MTIPDPKAVADALRNDAIWHDEKCRPLSAKLNRQAADLLDTLTRDLWECPDCAFAFHAMHKNESAEYTCPNCAETRLTAELAKAIRERDEAREALRPFAELIPVFVFCGGDPDEGKFVEVIVVTEWLLRAREVLAR